MLIGQKEWDVMGGGRTEQRCLRKEKDYLMIDGREDWKRRVKETRRFERREQDLDDEPVHEPADRNSIIASSNVRFASRK